MKLNKYLIIVLIIVFNVLAIIVAVPAMFSENEEYEGFLQEARRYSEQNLCEKAMISYSRAAEIQDDIALREEMANVYYRGIQNGEFSSYYGFSDFLFSMMDDYRKELLAYEIAIPYLFQFQQYEDCVAALSQAEKFQIDSEKISDIREKIKYLYEINFSTYENVIYTPEDGYLVKNEQYRFLSETMGPVNGIGYEYATPLLEGLALVKLEDATVLVSDNGRREAYFSNEISESTGVGDSLIACKVGDVYAYYDLQGNKLFGNYIFAGRFANGVAAVMTEEGWQIIDTEGKPINDGYFEEIKLSQTNDCAQAGIIIAKSKGKYGLYDCEATKIAEIAIDDADVFLEQAGYAACKIGDKWGYMDYSGQIVIAPQYAEAKSFSNGLAGVKEDDVWSFINSENEIVITGEFSDVSYFNKKGYCFTKGEIYWQYLSRYYNKN